MKVVVELVKPTGNVQTIVEVKGKVTPTFLDRVDRAVEKAHGKDDTWTRWNLVAVQEDA